MNRTIRTPQQQHEVSRYINRLEPPFTVRVDKAGRTNPQNARLWWLHGIMAAHLNRKLPELIKAKLIPGFFLFTAEIVHEGIFKPHYCGTHPDGRPKSSTAFDVSEFNDLLTAYESDMVHEGVELPTPPEWEDYA